MQRRQVTIAIGWNGQINRATAAEALHPAQLQPRWDDDFQRGSRDRGRERSPLAIGVAPTCTMERSPVLSRRSPRGRTGEVAIRFALQIENQYDHHYGNCNIPCYNRQPVYKTPFCKREKLPIQFFCQYEYVMMEWLFGVSAQSLTAVRQRRPPQGQK